MFTVLSFFVGGPAVAQVVAPPERIISGQVMDSLSGRPIQRAVLYFEGAGNEEFRSGTDGRFRIERVRPTDTIMVVRQIGFVPVRVPVPFSMSAIEIDVGSVRLRAVATKLDAIAVEAEQVRRYPHLDDFFRRRQLGLAGFFMAPDEITRASARKTSNLVERSVKVKTECNDNGRWQKGAAFDCTALNRRPQGAAGMGVEQCELDVWVDGQRSTLRVDDIPVRTIVGLEVYSGAATTPAAFGSGHCGVVAIWTNGTTGSR